LLKWNPEDIGPNLLSNGRAIDRLALSAEVSSAVSEFEQWLSLESWYKSRGIPWRTNWLCYGPPGTGKSSIVQALAEDHGLPIWVFDLAMLYNDELHRNWNRMLEQVPCIALIEDLDKVFETSKNISNGELTLDCLLNCIDGVSRANGLFLVMTTNRIDALDPALKRPGRPDSILEMGPPDEAGLLKIARRILPEHEGVCGSLVENHKGMSGAEFQRLCEREALRLLKAGSHHRNGRYHAKPLSADAGLLHSGAKP
jgi:SpoVK/Ycf46/Vps4 family AAA+-type ATPase